VPRVLAPFRQAIEFLAVPARRVQSTYRGVTGGWHNGIVYHDDLVTLDSHSLTIHGYYVPFGRKRIPYETISAVDVFPLSGGRAYRIHGPGWGRVWYARDLRRGERSSGVIIDIDNWLRPVVTVENPTKVMSLLRDRLSSAG
jgi:hypothetical protein